MGHANFSIKGKTLVDVLDKLIEWKEKHPASSIERVTLVVKEKNKSVVVGDCGIEFEIEKIYGSIEDGYNLILSVIP